MGTGKAVFLSDNMEFFIHGGQRGMKTVFGSIRGVVKLKVIKLSNSSCNKWTWKD